MRKRWLAGAAILTLLLAFPAENCRAAMYYGNAYDPQNPGTGGAINGGRLNFTDNGTTVSGTFYKGNDPFSNDLVIYLDSTPGGFADTTGFTDAGGNLQKSVSAWNGSSRCTVNFASGFGADYAIALGTDRGGTLFRLVRNGSFEEIGSVGLTPMQDQLSPSYQFHFDWTDIGLSAGPGRSFAFETTDVIWGNVYNESFEPFTGTGGWGHTLTFNRFDVYPTPVPEMTNAALATFGGLLAAVTLILRTRRGR